MTDPEGGEQGVFRLRVLRDFMLETDGGIEVRLDENAARLTAVLVATGGQPIAPIDLAYELDVVDTALKNWLSRRRQVLGPDVLPRLTKGDPGHRLALSRDEVDAWWLLDQADRPLDDATDERLIAALQAGEPFPGLAGSDTGLIDAARRQIRRAQRSVAIASVRAERRVVMAAITDLVAALVTEDPYDEDLAEANARLQAAVFGRRHGLEALHQTRLRLLDAGLSPSVGLEALEQELLGEPVGVSAVGSPTGPFASGSASVPAGLPSSLERLRPHPYLSPVPVVLPAGSEQPQWWTVTGPAGAGKTTFVAEVASAAVDAGAAVLHLEPFPFGPEPWFKLFETAMPDVQQLIAELTEAKADVAAFRHAVMTAVRANLDEMAAAQPLQLIITKAHRLEAEAIEVLWYLARSTLPPNLAVVVSGDTNEMSLGTGSSMGDGVSPQWESFAAGLVDSGIGQSLPVPQLGTAEVDQLLRHLHPDLSRQQALLLAARISESSGGLPGLVLPLARSLSIESGRLAGDAPVEQAAWQLVSGLSEQVQLLGAAAAVCGLRFSARDVAAVAGSERDVVLSALNTLYHKGIVATDAPIGHYRFTTVAVARAFLEAVLPEQRLIWRQRAADLFADDPVRRARQIVTFAPEEEAVAALIEAAEAHVARGQHHEAAASFEQAVAASSGPLKPSECVGYVRALDLSGRHEEADKTRDDGFRRAVEIDDHSTGLALLLASWPEAELFADAETLVARLDRLNPERLTPDERVIYGEHWSRHLTMAGRPDDAARVLQQAMDFITSPDEEVGLAVASRFVEWTRSTPAQCLDSLHRVRPLLRQVTMVRRVDLLAHHVVDAYESGSTERFESVREELWAVVDQAGPVRRWHALLLDGVRAADAGDAAAAAIHRQEAFDYAVAHGIRHALEVSLASEVADRYLLEQPLDYEGLPQQVQRVGFNQQSPLPVQAGMALLLDAAGEADQAVAVAEEVAERALARPHFLAFASAAIVAPVLARSRREPLRLQTRDLLLRRGDILLLFGSFIAGLGPVTRYAEYLEPRRSERVELNRRTCRLAEQAGLARWLELTSG